MSFDIPILLIVWRRPTLTAGLIHSLKTLAPGKLYVSCDGPRPQVAGEQVLVEATKSIVKTQIDWDCTLHTRFLDKNLGCKYGVISAISWFFEHEEAGIILEDDCLPNESFYDYITAMLEAYKQELSVGCISGTMAWGSSTVKSSSIYFSKYTHSWGWATWRDRWEKFLESSSLESPFSLFNTHFPADSLIEYLFWHRVFLRLEIFNIPDTWDYQWFLFCACHNLLCVHPPHNLVKNLGMDSSGFHHSSGENIPALDTINADIEYVDIPVMRSPKNDILLFTSVFRPLSSPRRCFTLLMWSLPPVRRMFNFFLSKRS